MADRRELIHATAIVLDGRAALIRGPAGSGKSDLALRCINRGASPLVPQAAVLLADDQVWVEKRENTLQVVAPEAIRGLIEVRGLGVVTVPFVPEANAALVVEIVARDRIERLPDPLLRREISGIHLALLELFPFDASAPDKVLLALSRVSAAR